MASRGTKDEGVDALGALRVQNAMIAEMLTSWNTATERLNAKGDDVTETVDARWQRGSAAKLLLQHLAVREAAKQAIASRLDETGHGDLAARIEGNGPARRQAIDRLEELERGRMAITLNSIELGEAVANVAGFFASEAPAENEELIPAAEQALGEPGKRGLPTARSVRMQSVTHPNPSPVWYERIAPLKAVMALYQHLRGSPTGGTSPGVSHGREHLPGPRP